MTSKTQLILIIGLLSTLTTTLPSCLIHEEPISHECLQKIEIQELVSESPQTSIHLCSILLKEGLLNKAEEVCGYSAPKFLQFHNGNMYNLMQVYIRKEKLVEAIQCEYQAFWANPFHHQTKLKEVVDNYKTLFEGIIESNRDEKRTMKSKIEEVIALMYLGKTKQASQKLNLYIRQSQERDDSGFWSFLPKLMKLRLMDQLGQFPDGLDYVQKMINEINQKQNDEFIGWFLFHIKGNLLMHHIKFQQAVQSFQESIKQLSSTHKHSKTIEDKFNIVITQLFPLSYYNIALCLQKTNKYELSTHYLKALIEHPIFEYYHRQCEDCYNTLGMAYFQMGSETNNPQKKKKNYQLAHKYYSKAEEYSPQTYTAIFNLGALYLQLKMHKEALQKFQRVLEIDGSIISAKYGKLKAQYPLDAKGAMKYLQQIIATPQVNLFDVSKLVYQLGEELKCLQLLNKHVTKIEQSQQSLSRQQILHIFTWKGLIQHELDKSEQSQISLEKAIAINGDKAEPEVYDALANIYRSKSKGDPQLISKSEKMAAEAEKRFKKRDPSSQQL